MKDVTPFEPQARPEDEFAGLEKFQVPSLCPDELLRDTIYQVPPAPYILSDNSPKKMEKRCTC
jgi:hypothetical protein